MPTPQAFAADPGKTLRFTYGSGDAAHPYIVYVPRSYRASQATPLLVMAHGCQTTAQEQMRANLYNGLAERKGFIVMYPDTNADEDAQPGPLRRCWRFFDQNDWHRVERRSGGDRRE